MGGFEKSQEAKPCAFEGVTIMIDDIKSRIETLDSRMQTFRGYL